MKKSIISILLAAAMTIAALGITAFAQEEFFTDNDPINVVFLGGSITEGTSGSYGSFVSGSGYTTYIDKYLKETYGTNRVVCYNSGIGGTGSDFGFNRLYDMGIKYNPDLVFVEFAVNDYWSMEGTRNTMEAIVRGLQTMENPPYIVFVYTAQYNASNTSDISNSTKAASWQQEVADYYGIPSINLSEDVYKPYVAKRVSEGAEQLVAIQEFLSSDKVHPTANGHKLYGEYIVEKLKTGDYYKKAAVKDEWYLNDPKYDYVPHGVSITPDMITGTYSMSSDNTRYVLDTGSSLTYRFSGPMISAYTILNRSGGQYDISVDGRVVNTASSYRDQGYDQRWLGFWIKDLDPNVLHTLRLTVKSGKLDIRNLYAAEGDIPKEGIAASVNNNTAEVTVTGNGIDVENGENVTVTVLYPGVNEANISPENALEEIALVEQCKIENKGFTVKSTLPPEAVSGMYSVGVVIFNDHSGKRLTSFTYDNIIMKQKAEDALEASDDMYSYLNTYLKYVDGDKSVRYNGLTDEEKKYAAGCITDKSKLKEQLGAALDRIDVLKQMKEASGTKLEELLKSHKALLGIETEYASYSALTRARQEIAINAFASNLKNVTLPDGVAAALKDAVKKANDYTVSSGKGSGTSGGGSSGGSAYGASAVTNPASDKLLPVPEEKAVFEDLSEAAWAIPAVTMLYEKGVIKGKTETKFCPNDMITREEFVKLVVEAFEIEEEAGTVGFKDVDNDAWYAPYISIAVKKNVIKGISSEEFGVGNPIKRQDVLVILDRVVSNETNVEANVVDEDVFFEDTEDIDTYAMAPVYRMLKAKIASGKDDGKLYPQEGTTRAEAVQMIYNLLKK